MRYTVWRWRSATSATYHPSDLLPSTRTSSRCVGTANSLASGWSSKLLATFLRAPSRTPGSVHPPRVRAPARARLDGGDKNSRGAHRCVSSCVSSAARTDNQCRAVRLFASSVLTPVLKRLRPQEDPLGPHFCLARHLSRFRHHEHRAEKWEDLRLSRLVDILRSRIC